MEQLSQTDAPRLFYALVVRLDGAWAAFLIIRRATLQELWDQGLGSPNRKSGDLELHVQFRPEEDAEDAQGGQGPKLTARCGTEKTKVFDLSEYLNAWETLPPLRPLAPSAAAEQPPGLQLFEADPGEVD
jgi:hypothetical protein